MKHYYVAPLYYLPVGHAISLINKGYSTEDAINITIQKFAYFGKRNSKRNKEFNQIQFRKHINKFLSIPNAVLVRKSPKRNRFR